ncbi:MAG: hypothetical protein WED11_09985, partial [Natronospirillum sp.]
MQSKSRSDWLSQRIAAIVAHVSVVVMLSGLLIGGAIIVYITGGTTYAYPFLLLAIVAVSAALYGFWGGTISALVAGLILSPFMPIDTYVGVMQSTTSWLVRLLFYIILGAIIGGLFSLVFSINRKHAESLRKDARTELANSAALDFDLDRMLRRLQPQQNVQLTFVQLTDLADILDTLGPDAADQAVRRITDS